MLVNAHYSPGKMFAVPFTSVKCNLALDSPVPWAGQTILRGQEGWVWTPVAYHPSSHTNNFQETISAPLLTSQKGGSPSALICAVSVDQRSLALHSQRDAPSLTWGGAMAHGEGEEHTVHTASSSAGNADVPKPPETGSCYPCKAKPCVQGQRGQAAALSASGRQPCPLTWTSGTKHVRAVSEQLSPEPGQGSQEEGCYRKALPAKFFLCCIKPIMISIVVQSPRAWSPCMKIKFKNRTLLKRNNFGKISEFSAMGEYICTNHFITVTY